MSYYDSFWETGKGIAVIMAGIVLGGILITGAVMAIGRQAEMPASLAKIEQLRSDAAHVDPTQAEDVIGQVTVWNQTIRENQALNATWWAGWLIPRDVVGRMADPRRVGRHRADPGAAMSADLCCLARSCDKCRGIKR